MRPVSLAVALVLATAACAAPVPKAFVQTTGASDGGLRFAELGTCKLESGAVIEDCRIGYRTYGHLDAAKANAVLQSTWFSGTTEPLAEAVPDKLVDTKRFFLVLVEALGSGVSSSPSNSSKQPRLAFPRFTIRDMVETQRRLLREVLHIEKLHTVLGISMGGMQAWEWAVSHPDEVGRVISIAGTPQLTATDLLFWHSELDLLDDSATYAKGEYKGRPAIPALREMHWFALTTPPHRNAETSRAAYPAWRAGIAKDAAFDWNDWHRQLEAMIAHDVAHGGDLAEAARKVKAKALVLVADRDQMVNPGPSKTFAESMPEGQATFTSLDTPCGHMFPGCEATLGPRIKAFMETR